MREISGSPRTRARRGPFLLAVKSSRESVSMLVGELPAVDGVKRFREKKKGRKNFIARLRGCFRTIVGMTFGLGDVLTSKPLMAL